MEFVEFNYRKPSRLGYAIFREAEENLKNKKNPEGSQSNDAFLAMLGAVENIIRINKLFNEDYLNGWDGDY